MWKGIVVNDMLKNCFLARFCKIAECPEYSKALLVVFYTKCYWSMEDFCKIKRV